jgi:2-hydroxychromene-2-carboxylate isomerase
MQQEFKPVALGGSASTKAHTIAEDIIRNDYHVADFNREHRREGTPKVRYTDQNSRNDRSSWGTAHAALETAIASGRQIRQQYGSGLDVLQANLKSGAQRDLIAASKERSIKIW